MGRRPDDTKSRTRIWRFRHIATRHLNPIVRRFAGRLPGLGIVTHTGRRSGRVVKLVEPDVVTDPELRPAPAAVRFVEGRLAGVTQYLRMRAAE